MNPGLLDVPLTLESRSGATDELGQPLEAWAEVGRFFGRRMRPRAGEETLGDRQTETLAVKFRVRSQPFLSLYQPGMRFRAAGRGGLPETVWRIEGWGEVDGTLGMYLDVSGVAPEGR